MRSAASSRGWRCSARPGSDVNTTQMVSLAGSAQQRVPVEPVWPKVRSEQPGLPARLPTPNPNPRGVNPFGLWFLIISRAVSGLMTLPRAPMNSPRNLARSGAEACVPPQGAPSFRQYGLFQSHSLADLSPLPDSGAAPSIWQEIISSSLNRPSP